MKSKVEYSSRRKEYKVTLEHDGVMASRIIPEFVLLALGKDAGAIYEAADTAVLKFNENN